jgi:O-antigen ligase
LLFTANKPESWLDLQLKTGLVLIPAAILSTCPTSKTMRERLSLYFITIIAAASLYCIGFALWNYYLTGNSSFFFYHILVHPIGGHAIYFSVLVFIALIFLVEDIERNNFIMGRFPHFALVAFLSVFLFLLSSKLVIGFYFLYLLARFAGLIKSRSANLILVISLLVIFIAGGTIAFTTNNPVSRRFSDILNGDLRVVNQETFNPGMYFNGVQFRLLQWKFTGEILCENHGWLTGVGPGNAQHLLDQKYISSNMYVGEPSRGDHGFLGYNTHNQFLETLLKTGVFGLIILLFIYFILIRMARQKKKRSTSFIISLLLIWLFTESVLERQYGIVIFTFFPLFLWLDEK